MLAVALNRVDTFVMQPLSNTFQSSAHNPCSKAAAANGSD